MYQYFISLLLNNISLYGYTMFPPHSLVDGHLDNLFLIQHSILIVLKWRSTHVTNSSAQKLLVTPWHTLKKGQSPYNGLQGPKYCVCTLLSLFLSSHTWLTAVLHTCQACYCSQAFTLSVPFACTFLMPDIYTTCFLNTLRSLLKCYHLSKCLDEMCFPTPPP